jgi:hypothetical protein
MPSDMIQDIMPNQVMTEVGKGALGTWRWQEETTSGRSAWIRWETTSLPRVVQ